MHSPFSGNPSAMPLSSRYLSPAALALWVIPLAYVLITLTLNYLAGTLTLPAEGDVRAQRDFNAAVGMPVVTGYLWFTVRLLHRRTASTIVNYLIAQQRMAEFSYYRDVLTRWLQHQVIIAASIALLVTTVYLASEGLLALDLQIGVLLLNVTAVPFWFFIWLYLLQVTTTTRFISRRLISSAGKELEDIKLLKPFSDLGLSNAIHAVFSLLIIPVFWFGKDIPTIDILILSIFGGGLFVYLLLPVFRMQTVMKKLKAQAVKRLTARMQDIYEQAASNPQRKQALLRSLNRCQDQIEDIQAMSVWPIDVHQSLKILCAFLLIPLSWACLSLAEYLAT